ncbi:hypothetical protein AVEN_181573-1 [Araneus ventricosus]|uniref:Uncharacterized protein n=1 Tax=Araneus ventricosus TaxID=182803 RepID=A0A4Y2E451_ARAVE|nr:hypothetical protein AVEN_181573-1 [Araneus ventricosus]
MNESKKIKLEPNSSCIKFFALLSHQQYDFVLNVVIISSSSPSSDEYRLGLSLGCKVDAVALKTRLSPKRFSSVLKQQLGGKYFADVDDVQHEVLLWMRQQLKEFYAAGIGALIKRWDKCINISGDYVEK